MKSLKAIIKSIVSSYREKRHSTFYTNQFKRYLIRLGINHNATVKGENAYIDKWSVFNKPIEPYSYRLFSRYCGYSPDIIPEFIGTACIESKLNPVSYRPFYSDKNGYSMYLDSSNLPVTIVKRIQMGGVLTANNQIVKDDELLYRLLKSERRIILKPSVDSGSGRGVTLFEQINGRWLSNEQQPLSLDYLMKYGPNFVLQKAVEQSDYMAHFCSTSVNTLRIATYRSVVDEQVHVIGSIMRIGKDGSFVDNAHAGGVFVGIDTVTGKVKDKLYNQYGESFESWNGVDYAHNTFSIPQWNKVLELARYVGEHNIHCRLLALDIALDCNNNPVLIEYNCDGFSYWLFMYTGNTVFGDFTDEVIHYCITTK